MSARPMAGLQLRSDSRGKVTELPSYLQQGSGAFGASCWTRGGRCGYWGGKDSSKWTARPSLLPITTRARSCSGRTSMWMPCTAAAAAATAASSASRWSRSWPMEGRRRIRFIFGSKAATSSSPVQAAALPTISPEGTAPGQAAATPASTMGSASARVGAPTCGICEGMCRLRGACDRSGGDGSAAGLGSSGEGPGCPQALSPPAKAMLAAIPAPSSALCATRGGSAGAAAAAPTSGQKRPCCSVPSAAMPPCTSGTSPAQPAPSPQASSPPSMDVSAGGAPIPAGHNAVRATRAQAPGGRGERAGQS
mmetsp:Transcript_305/g.1304  ORF Transcript_305/g.1304 Transcript_305/m.1304 type:complete len:308 (-) Transcript_305:3-926(-)